MALFDPPSLADVGWSLAAAAAGRATLMLRAARRTMTWHWVLWTLAWEVPITAACGIIGWGLADWAQISGGGATVLIALVARYGPDRLEPLLEQMLPTLGRRKLP